MILSDKTIRRLLEQGTLRMQPLSPGQIQPASVDVRLGDTFGIVEDLASGVISMEREICYKTIRAQSYLLLPGQFVLATTLEYVSLPDDLTAFVEGRSSLGRMGGCLFRMQAGSTPALKGKSRWSYSTPTGAPSSCGPGRGWGSWCLPGWTLRRSFPIGANIRGSAGQPARGPFSILKCRSPKKADKQNTLPFTGPCSKGGRACCINC